MESFSFVPVRHIYLVRHGEPEFPNGQRCCIGRTDLPLSQQGRIQAQRLQDYFTKTPLTAVYCSTLTRAVQTAEIIAQNRLPVNCLKDLQELDSGLWEGLTFEEIRREYPELYAKRGAHPDRFFPENGEPFADALPRFWSAVDGVIRDSFGDIAIVAHASVNRLLLCFLLKKPFSEIYTIHQPYGCINDLIIQNEILQVKRISFMPDEFPDEAEIQLLWKKYHTPEPVIAHCRAVAEKAEKLARQLAESGCSLNSNLIFSAALLHDIARAEPDHPARGADWLTREGYEAVAEIIAAHHELDEQDDGPVTEKTVVYAADKLICGDSEISLEERFAKSLAKCTTPEAKSAHERKYRQAQAAIARIWRQIEKEKKK